MTTIKDGTGSGYIAKVDNRNRLHTRAVSTDEAFFSLEDGRAFNINTGVIDLSNAVDTPCIYLKNDETQTLVITSVAIGVAASTGGSATIPVEATFIRNPTTGTIITSTPTDVDINSNRNFGSSGTLTADVYKGATGDTMTDGENHIFVYLSHSARAFITIHEAVPKGKTFGVKIKAPASNTSLKVYVALICHLIEEN